MQEHERGEGEGQQKGEVGDEARGADGVRRPCAQGGWDADPLGPGGAVVDHRRRDVWSR